MSFRDILPPRERERSSGASAGLALAGLAAGAAVVALFEPRGGARRRGLIVQRATHAGKAARSFGEKAGRDLANRSRGALASARTIVGEGPVLEDVLSERVRSRIGRLTSHPSAIEVSATGGVVELRGPILEAECDELVAGVRRVRGVHDVVDRLERHAQPGSVHGLQGGSARPRPVPERLQQSWAPGTRLLAIVAGGGLATAARGRHPAAMVLRSFGVLLGLRGATDLPLKRLFRIGARRRAVDLHGKAEGATREEVRPS